ncbi:MAG: hypothetical protein ACJAS9_001410 [Polaribacter sp.]|jgi:hypothetical protein
MKELTRSLEICLENENWYGALFIALTLPDICGKIDAIHNGSRARYSAWFNEYVQEKYTVNYDPERELKIFLSGNDCYALRCSYLHEGQEDISGQQAQEVIENFHFIAPIPNMCIHNNMMGKKLQLQVDLFCKDILEGIDAWLNNISECDTKAEKLKSLLMIQSPNPNGSFSI